MLRSYLQHPIDAKIRRGPLPLPVGSFGPTQVGTLWTGTLPFHTQLRLVDVLLYHGQHGYLVSCIALAKGSAALIGERTSPGEVAAALREAWRPEVCALFIPHGRVAAAISPSHARVNADNFEVYQVSCKCVGPILVCSFRHAPRDTPPLSLVMQGVRGYAAGVGAGVGAGSGDRVVAGGGGGGLVRSPSGTGCMPWSPGGDAATAFVLGAPTASKARRR
jgi:hypothetical protein